MKIIYRGKFKHVAFTFAVGDLFDAKVDAIVNSEQTDFVLSGNPESISGQIWRRYGRSIQQELDEATDGEILRAGTVIATSGGKDFTRIFHAGFHEPEDWSDTPGGSQVADYFEVIGSCIRQVLALVSTQGLSSVAFPLIGCGRFGLDEKMLVLQFLDAIETLDHRLRDGEGLDVWLVIRDRGQFEFVVGKFLELLMGARREMIALQINRTGVPILDRFAACLARRSNEDWAKWQLCRFAEIAVEIMCFGLARATSPAQTPETLFEKERPPAFGDFRDRAVRFAVESPINVDAWGTKFFTSVLKDSAAAGTLEAVNAQRNKIAHGQKSLPLAEVEKLVFRSLQLDDWAKIADADGELQLADWIPWVVTSTETTGQTGLFERWQKNAIRYLVPETGEVFKVPRKYNATVN